MSRKDHWGGEGGGGMKAAGEIPLLAHAQWKPGSHRGTCVLFEACALGTEKATIKGRSLAWGKNQIG